MQKSMQVHAAVFRTGDVLKEGCRQMSDIFKESADLKVNKVYGARMPATPLQRCSCL